MVAVAALSFSQYSHGRGLFKYLDGATTSKNKNESKKIKEKSNVKENFLQAFIGDS